MTFVFDDLGVAVFLGTYFLLLLILLNGLSNQQSWPEDECQHHPGLRTCAHRQKQKRK